MALLGIIRRWYIRDRISIREIARRLDISRNTVRRYIRSEAVEPSYPTRRSSSSLDEFVPRLSTWLTAEAAKSRKQRRTLKQMFLDLKELGYEGSYDRVAAFGRQWKVGQLERVNSASKSTLAAALGVEIETISRYENGRLNTSLDQVDIFATFFNVPVWTLFTPTDLTANFPDPVLLTKMRSLSSKHRATLKELIQVYYNAHSTRVKISVPITKADK